MVDAVFLEGAACECDVTLDTWLKDSLPLLPGIQRNMAARELVLAAREFFERTHAWRTVIEDINAKAGQKQYWQSPYDQFSNVIGILGVTWKGTPLGVLHERPASLGQTDPGVSSSPTHYWVDPAHPDTFYLYPTLEADVDDVLDVYVALTPKQSVEHLPRVAAIKFYDAILEGFLARVLRHPNKPYSSPATAVLHRRSFLNWCARYTGQAKQGFSNAQAWSFPQSWKIRRRAGW
jgi:hypothetical protein